MAVEAVSVAGRTVHVVAEAHTDCHFVSLSTTAQHGAIIVASIDRRAFESAEDDVGRAAAVETSVLLGKRDDTAGLVAVRQLAVRLASSGDDRPLTVCVNFAALDDASPSQRREFVMALVEHVAQRLLTR